MNSSSKDKLLIITYFSGIDGCCPAEWADDKVDSYLKNGKSLILISSVCSRKVGGADILHYRVPSLSFADWKTERSELKTQGSDIPISMYMLLPLVLTVGALLDYIQKIKTDGIGGGKWSWALPASVCALYILLRHRCSMILTTGGPASAHLAGVVCKWFSRKRVVAELQDPLCGDEIGRNATSSSLLAKVERVMARYLDKIVYVTEEAAKEARLRLKANNIGWLYPGAKLFELAETGTTNNEDVLTMVHLGTLYSTRNFDSLIQAVELLIERGLLSSDDIRIVNMGEIYGDYKEYYLSKSYVSQEGIVPRQVAVKKASTFDVCLLIQHTDDRSRLTIPYKTYDYLNIGNQILGLTNNIELDGLLRSYGHSSCPIVNVEDIAQAILELRNKKREEVKPTDGDRLCSVEQAEKLIQL